MAHARPLELKPLITQLRALRAEMLAREATLAPWLQEVDASYLARARCVLRASER